MKNIKKNTKKNQEYINSLESTLIRLKDSCQCHVNQNYHLLNKTDEELYYYIDAVLLKPSFTMHLYFHDESQSEEQYRESLFTFLTQAILKIKKENEQREKDKQHERKRRELYLLWIRMSEGFFKLASIPFYITSILITLYGLYWIAIPILTFVWYMVSSFVIFLINLLLTVSFWEVCNFVLTSLMYISCAILTCSLIWKSKLLQIFFEVIKPGFLAVSDGSIAFVEFIIRTAQDLTEFASMFYTENCPPIILEENLNE